MKQFIKHTPYLVSLLILLGITSCTKMDEYLKYGLPRSTGIRP